MSAYCLGVKRTSRPRFTYLLLPFIAFAMAGCSSKNQSPAPDQSQASPSFFGFVTDTVKGSVRGAFEAVQTPFEDVGIKRQSIPDQLKKMPADPYALPTPADCSTVAAAIADLNAVLGADMVAKKTGGDNSSLVSAWNNAKNITWENRNQYIQQSSSMLQQKAADEVRNHVSIIPYRTWVRWVSGADSHAKKVAEAYEAGKVHRAFLRGYQINMHCKNVTYAESAAEISSKPAKPAKKTEVTEQEDMDTEETALNDEKETR